MPAATEYITDPDNAGYKAQRNAAEEELKARREIYAKNLNYYLGKHKEWLKVGADGISDNVIINLCKLALDRKIAFLFPTMPQILLTDDGKAEESEKTLADDWAKNGGASLCNELGILGGLAGHNFARVVQGENGQPNKFLILSPTAAIKFWRADNYKEVLWYEIYGEVGKTQIRQDVVKDGARWVIWTYQKKGSAWELLTDDAEIIWPYELGPVVDWHHKPKANNPYGDHEFNHAALNDMVNLTASNIAKILRFHAHPLTVTDDSSISKDSFIASGPSKILKVGQGKQVYNVEMQSDLASSMNFLQWLGDKFLEQSKVVTLPPDVRAFANVTNFGIRAAFLPMSDDNEVLRRQYGWAIAEISKRDLMLRGVKVDRDPIVKYGDPLPVNQLENTNMYIGQYNAGFVSRQTASEALGHNFMTEQTRNEADADFAGLLADKYMNLQPPMGGGEF